MLETILQSFSFISHTASEELIFKYFFRKFCLLVAMVIGYNKKVYLVEDTQGTFLKKFCQNICNEIHVAVNANFYFFPL